MDANWIIRKIKLGETPVFKAIRALLRAIDRPSAPRIPNFLRPVLRLAYEFHFLIIMAARWLLVVVYRHPLFQARCASVGRGLSLERLPYVTGHAEIHIGDNVYLGSLSIYSGRFVERPRLIIKDRAEISGTVVVNKEVIIEEDARIAPGCRISDSDGHPRQADLRAQNAPVDLADIRPVRICRYAWIGNGCHIMKGVTIGEGAVIGANSVVISDIPPYSLAMGNPAEVYFRNYGRPSKEAASP